VQEFPTHFDLQKVEVIQENPFQLSDRRVGVLENLRFLVCHLNSKFVRVAGLIAQYEPFV
jgi:hypothetical protein